MYRRYIGGFLVSRFTAGLACRFVTRSFTGALLTMRTTRGGRALHRAEWVYVRLVDSNEMALVLKAVFAILGLVVSAAGVNAFELGREAECG